MEREIQIGDLVRIAAKCFEPCAPSLLVGLVVEFPGLRALAPDSTEWCAKIEWFSGVFTVEGLSMLERVQ